MYQVVLGQCHKVYIRLRVRPVATVPQLTRLSRSYCLHPQLGKFSLEYTIPFLRVRRLSTCTPPYCVYFDSFIPSAL